jgi:hypothetical protein
VEQRKSRHTLCFLGLVAFASFILSLSLSLVMPDGCVLDHHCPVATSWTEAGVASFCVPWHN